MDFLNTLAYYQSKGFMFSYFPNECFSVSWFSGWNSFTNRYDVVKEVIPLKQISTTTWQEVEAVLDLFLESVEEEKASA